MPVFVRAGLLDGARSLLIPSQGSGPKRGRVRLRCVQWKEKGEVMMDRLHRCVAQGPCGLVGPWLFSFC